MCKRLASTLFAVFFLLAFSMPALASPDVTPPKVLSVTMDKTTCHLGDTVMVTVVASDTESGLSTDNANFRLYHAQKSREIYFHLQSLDEQNGIYKFTFTVTPDILSGDYRFPYLCIMDKTGNIISASEKIDPPNLLPELSLTIDNPEQPLGDCTPPTLDSISFSPNSGLRPGDIVHITVKAHDDTGLADSYIQMYNENASYNDNPAFLKPTGPDTLEADYKISTSMKSGIWMPMSMQLFDSVANVTNLNLYGIATSSFTVINDTNMQRPLITDIQVSSTEVTVGETITFCVSVDPRGNQLQDGMSLYVLHAKFESNILGTSIDLYKAKDGRYIGEWKTTPKKPFGEYYITGMSICNNEFDVSPALYHHYDGQFYDRLQRIMVNSMFCGTDNRVLTVGQSFDPMAGVTAGGGVEADLTSAIAVEGKVDTAKPGLYLLRYRVPGTSQTWNEYTNQYETNVYMDFRWVGVSELPQTASPAAGSVQVQTNDDLQIVLPDSTQVNVRRDGTPIPYQQVNTAAGLYSVSLSGDASGGTRLASAASQRAPSAEFNKSMSARVDRQGPTITYTVADRPSSKVLTMQATDEAGIQSIKWLPSWVSAAECADHGTAFDGTLSVEAGKYTLFAADALGNTSAQQIQVFSTSPPNIQPPSTPPTATQTPSNYLYGIGLSAGGLNRGFSPGVTGYTINLGENDPAVTISPAKAYDGAVMTIDGKAVPAKTIALANGKSATVTIKVTLGKKSTTYKLKVQRAKSTSNALAALNASGGAWSQPFDPAVTTYTLALPENMGKVSLNTMRASGLATVSPAKGSFTLKNGQTVRATFKVKAQSGAVRTYTVLITRARSTNANLGSLKLSAKGMAPGFHPAVADYAITLPAKTASVTIAAKAADKLATVRIDGAKKASLAVKLANGQTTAVTVTVTAQSGDVKTYTIAVSRQ